MTYETHTEKSLHNGWTAETTIELEKINDKETRYIKFTTDKKSTNASVFVEEDQGQFTVEKFAIFEDYMKTVARHSIKRSTEKAVLTAHENVQNLFGEHIEAAKAQYGLVEAA